MTNPDHAVFIIAVPDTRAARYRLALFGLAAHMRRLADVADAAASSLHKLGEAMERIAKRRKK